MKKTPIVAIVGKPNAGKSTLFNRIVRRRKAIMHATRGVTRDSVEEKVTWNGVTFVLVDTGGFSAGTKDQITREVRTRVKNAAREAAVIIFVVDIDTGVTEEDASLLRDLRREREKMILVVNKIENDADRWSVHEFHTLGFKDMHVLSAIHGTGIGEVLDDVTSRLPRKAEAAGPEPIAIAIVGKPNVGKSSLVNAL
ncbi:MAG: GTP-binding protein, partial [Candidatus Krumholzibacteria bacterium]|nr:GTP-binding protein [Candidatus Krumholzibacteria bacterium]